MEYEITAVAQQEFRMDKGVQGNGRVERLPTGFTTTVYNDNKPDVKISIRRGVDLEGVAHIDIDIESIDQMEVNRSIANLEAALTKEGLGEHIHQRSDEKLRIYSTDMQRIFLAFERYL